MSSIRCVAWHPLKCSHCPGRKSISNSGCRSNCSMSPAPKQSAGTAILGIPLLQKFFVGSYVVRQRLAGRKRYPLVLMLEPLFRCNLACAGCGKIDYPDEILHENMSVG